MRKSIVEVNINLRNDITKQGRKPGWEHDTTLKITMVYILLKQKETKNVCLLYI